MASQKSASKTAWYIYRLPKTAHAERDLEQIIRASSLGNDFLHMKMSKNTWVLSFKLAVFAREIKMVLSAEFKDIVLLPRPIKQVTLELENEWVQVIDDYKIDIHTIAKDYNAFVLSSSSSISLCGNDLSNLKTIVVRLMGEVDNLSVGSSTDMLNRGAWNNSTSGHSLNGTTFHINGQSSALANGHSSTPANDPDALFSPRSDDHQTIPHHQRDRLESSPLGSLERLDSAQIATFSSSVDEIPPSFTSLPVPVRELSKEAVDKNDKYSETATSPANAPRPLPALYRSVSLHGIHTSKGLDQLTTPVMGLKVQITQGNLITQSTQAIVNPANNHLKHRGGAAKAIADAAGLHLKRECDEFIRVHRSLPTTHVMHTIAGNLPRPIQYVIHAVGPNIKDHEYDVKYCAKLLETTFINCLQYANEKLKIASISVPAISSGVFGVPKELVARAAYTAIMKFDSSGLPPKMCHLKSINLVNIDGDTTQCFKQIFDKLHQSLVSVNTTNAKLNGKVSSSEPEDTTSITSKSEATAALGSGFDDNDVIGVKQKQPIIGRPTKSTSSSGAGPEGCSTCGKKTATLVPRKDCMHKFCSHCRSVPCAKCNTTLRKKALEGHTDDQNHTSSPRELRRQQILKNQNDLADSSIYHTPDFASLQHHPSNGHDEAQSSDTTSATKVDRMNSGFKASGSTVRRSSSLSRLPKTTSDDMLCVICQDNIFDPKKLDCGHIFCRLCIDEGFKHQPKCPTCGRIFGMLAGTELQGAKMDVRTSMLDLEGYSGCGSLQIDYYVPSGIQSANHPHPGKPYYGTSRTAYLPNNGEGEQVLMLLRRAFDAHLIFTIGKSNTTGYDDSVIWNDIHHKTSTHGTYGYPDPTYFKRVRDELAAKGITDAPSPPAPPVTAGMHSDVSPRRRVLIEPKGSEPPSTSEPTMLSSTRKPDCAVCLRKVIMPTELPCGQSCCKACLYEISEHQMACRICSTPKDLSKAGQQPKGKIDVHTEHLSIRGYEGYGSIWIDYEIFAGYQKQGHPNPGKFFLGTVRTAFLPNNPEGQEVCELLRRAFDAGLIFTVGRSKSTGEDNCVIWTEIEHKTSMAPGPFGYPDSGYLKRVKQQLASKGIFPSTTSKTSGASAAIGTSTQYQHSHSIGGYDALNYTKHGSLQPRHALKGTTASGVPKSSHDDSRSPSQSGSSTNYSFLRGRSSSFSEGTNKKKDSSSSPSHGYLASHFSPKAVRNVGLGSSANRH